MNLNLPSGPALVLQVEFDAYVSGGFANNNAGDIAIDDIIINTDGQCDGISGK